MLSPFICGSFHSEEEDETSNNGSPCSTPKRSRKNNSKDVSKNPFSTRGLDKFSALLADLEEKRNKIYSQMGSQDISLVRFVYSSSNDCVPVVVKLKDRKMENPKTETPLTPKSESFDKYSIDPSSDFKEIKKPRLESEKKTNKINFSWNWNIQLSSWRRPAYYIPTVVIFILVLLTVFGRSVAILCTSIGWYLIPTIKTEALISSKKATKKKEYVRRLSENSRMGNTDGLKKKEYVRKSSEIKMVSDGLGLSSPKGINTNVGAAGQHGHRKSW